MRIRDIFGRSKGEILLYRAVLKDKRTPRISKIFLAVALGYFFLPFDVIPDFIPVLGQLDDIILIPLLIYFAMRYIPKEVIEENRGKIK